MKLLLTSAGLTNDTIVSSLRDLAGKDLKEVKFAFIPTAANPQWGDKTWLIDDLVNCKNVGFGELDIVDVSALPKNDWLIRLQNADIIMVGGGLTWYLMDWMRKSGLQEALPELLQSRVYVGISAGSMVTAPRLYSEQMQIIYDDDDIPSDGNDEALGLVDFLIAPHLGNKHFPKATEENAAKTAATTGKKLYLLDDESAVKAEGDTIEVVSEGKWKQL